MIFREVRAYIKEAGKLRRSEPDAFPLGDLAGFFPAWRRSLRGHAGALKDEAPWITFAAIRFLERVLSRSMRVYEYGSGGSTLFFCQRAGEVVSVEHDPSWYEKVRERVQARGRGNVEVRLIPPEYDEMSVGKDPSDPEGYTSGVDIYSGYSFRKYASSIDLHPDGSFDVILIDGRARPSCFLHSLPKVRTNGFIVWDNTDRGRYVRGMRLAAERFRFLDFPGPSPYVRFFTRTSAWQRTC